MKLDSLMGTDLDELFEAVHGSLKEVHEEGPAAAEAKAGPENSEPPKETNAEPLKAAVQKPEPQADDDMALKLKGKLNQKSPVT